MQLSPLTIFFVYFDNKRYIYIGKVNILIKIFLIKLLKHDETKTKTKNKSHLV